MKNRNIEAVVEGWTAPIRPNFMELEGQYVRLEKLSVRDHSAAIHLANSADDKIWDYLPYGPFDDLGAYQDWVSNVQDKKDPVFFAIFDKERGDWAGVASYLRVSEELGSIEVGHINFSRSLQQTRAATEAICLMMKWAFSVGYRRFEWKCNAANLRSCRAAQRFGFSYEGIFRQAAVMKGRNRDTAWFAMIDSEWPALEAAFTGWLSADNFDADGRQKLSLADLTAPILVKRDPRLT